MINKSFLFSFDYGDIVSLVVDGEDFSEKGCIVGYKINPGDNILYYVAFGFNTELFHDFELQKID